MGLPGASVTGPTRGGRDGLWPGARIATRLALSTDGTRSYRGGVGKELTPAQARARQGRARRWAITLAVAGVVVGLGALAWPRLASVESPHRMDDVRPLVRPGTRPLGQPPKAPQGLGSFSFVAEQQMSDDPVAYDPCWPVPYAITGRPPAPEADAIVDQAVRQVARATGLVFERHARAEQPWTFEFMNTSHGRSEVVIGWSDPEEITRLRGADAGLGRSIYMTDSVTAERFYVTGAVSLDTPQLGRLLRRPDGVARVRAVVMHQLAHVVGLADVPDDGELMYDGDLRRLTFGPGDREGLAALGSGSCY